MSTPAQQQAAVLDSAWRSGRFATHGPQHKLLFGRVYEDSGIEAAAFAGAERVFCIAAAGCTALALSAGHEVVACDVNPAQVAYVQRRLAGGQRELGSAERIMSLMRTLMPLAGWRRARLESFLSLADIEAQLAEWRGQLDNWRFRSGLWLLLSPLWLGRFYSSALLSSLPARFDRVLRQRLERSFARHPNRSNPYARALLLGHDAEQAQALPASSTRPPELVVADAASYLERCPEKSFGGVSLSNILDGAGRAYRERLFAAVRRAAMPGANVVLRSFGEPAPSLTTNRVDEDRSLLWGLVDVRPVEALE